MDQWTARVKEHQVFRLLESIETFFSHIDSLQNKEPRAQEFLERIHTVLLATQRALNAVDPALVSLHLLNNLQPQLESIQGQLAAFISSRSIGHLHQADTHSDNILSFMPIINGFGSVWTAEGMQEAAAALRTAYGKSLREFSAESDAVKHEFASLKQMVLELRGETANLRISNTQLMTDLQAQFSKAQEQRMSEFNTALKAWDAEYKEQFDSIREEAATTIKSASEEHAALRQQLTQALESEASASRNNSEKLIKELEDKRDQAKKLLEIIGNDAITSGYGKVADAASKERLSWQLVAVLSTAFLIALTIVSFIHFETSEFKWSSLAARISVALALGILFTYAARQADKAHGTEQRNRRIELELAAVGPYIASIPEDKQVQFKILMGERTFGREQTDASATPESALTDYITRPEVLKILLEALSNKDKSKGDK